MLSYSSLTGTSLIRYWAPGLLPAFWSLWPPEEAADYVQRRLTEVGLHENVFAPEAQALLCALRVAFPHDQLQGRPPCHSKQYFRTRIGCAVKSHFC